MTSSSSLDVQLILAELGDPVGWKIPRGYPDSLALCAIDAIWSLGVRYGAVEGVIDRYLKSRGWGGITEVKSCHDGPRDFLGWWMAQTGDLGPQEASEAVSEVLRNLQRTSSTGGVLKSQAVKEACELLAREGIESPSDLRTASDDLKQKWIRSVPGQRSGISWRYMTMLAGVPGVKPDRMVERFMRRMGVPNELTPDGLMRILVAELGTPTVNATVLDHRIWQIERTRKKKNNAHL